MAYIPRPFDVAPLLESRILKKYGFNWGCRMYYHTHYEHEIDNEQSIEACGDWSYSFHNKQNQHRCAAPYFWQYVLWCIVHPLKGYKATKEMFAAIEESNK